MTDHKSHQAQVNAHGGRALPHSMEVNRVNPADCTPKHACGAHAADHKHGPDCKHAAVQHGDHTDYVVAGHLHHPCTKHCDDHGPVESK